MALEVSKNVCTAVLVTPSGKIPVLRRRIKGGKFDGLYCFPGGTVETFDEGILREGLENHASREVDEELKVKIPPELFSHDGNSILSHGSIRMAISRWLAAWPHDEEIDITKDPDQDHDDVALVSADDYKSKSYIPGIKEYLDDLFAVERASGTLLAAISSYIRIHGFCFHHDSPKFLAIKNTKGKYILPKTFLTFADHVNNVLLKMLGKLTRDKVKACMGSWVDVDYLTMPSSRRQPQSRRASDRPPQRLLDARYVLYSERVCERFPITESNDRWQWFPLTLKPSDTCKLFVPDSAKVVDAVLSRLNKLVAVQPENLRILREDSSVSRKIPDHFNLRFPFDILPLQLMTKKRVKKVLS